MPYVFLVVAVVLGFVSVEMLREWNRGGWLSRYLLRPRDGIYEAKYASAAMGVWYCLGGFPLFSVGALLGAEANWGLPLSGWLVLGLIVVAAACWMVGLVVWLTMPNNLLVPRAVRGAPGYLAHKGWAGFSE